MSLGIDSCSSCRQTRILPRNDLSRSASTWSHKALRFLRQLSIFVHSLCAWILGPFHTLAMARVSETAWGEWARQGVYLGSLCLLELYHQYHSSLPCIQYLLAPSAHLMHLLRKPAGILEQCLIFIKNIGALAMPTPSVAGASSTLATLIRSTSSA
jgi:hypothetical protein